MSSSRYSQEGFFPLHYASLEGFDEIAEMLIWRGAIVDMEDKVDDAEDISATLSPSTH